MVIFPYLFIIAACSLFIVFQHNHAIQNALHKASPWQTNGAGEILVGLRAKNKQTSLFTPNGLHNIYAIDDAVESLAANDSTKRLIAPGYITAKNIDLVLPGELGSIKFAPFLHPAPENEKQLYKLLHQDTHNAPLLNTRVFSPSKQSLLYHLPLMVEGSTPLIKAQFDHITNAENPIQLLWGGLTYGAETYLTEVQQRLPLYFGVAALGIALIALLFTGSVTQTVSIVLPTISATILTYALQVATAFPTTVLSYLPTILSFGTTLVLGTYVVTQLETTREQQIDDQNAFLLSYTKLHYQLAVAVVPCLSCLLLVGVAQNTIKILALFILAAICIAWFTSVSLAPALLTLSYKKHNAKKLGVKLPTRSACALAWLAHWSTSKPIYVTIIHVVLFSLAALGLASLNVNETPLHWFNKDHPVVKDDGELNSRFNGVHQFRLILTAKSTTPSLEHNKLWLEKKLKHAFRRTPVFLETLLADIKSAALASAGPEPFTAFLADKWKQNLSALPVADNRQIDNWSKALDILSELTLQQKVFLRPGMLEYVRQLQYFALTEPHINKTLSVVDYITQAHQALFEGDPAHAAIPATTNGSAQALQSLQKRRPHGFIKQYINDTATQTGITFFTAASEPQTLTAISHKIMAFLQANPAPVSLEAEWTGPYYTFSLWQRKVTFSLLLWAGAALTVWCILFSLIHKSAKLGLALAILVLYFLLLTYGLSGLLFTISGVLFTATMLIPMLLALLLTGYKLSNMKTFVAKYGRWNSELGLSTENTFADDRWICTVLPLLVCLSLLALFSAYSSLRITGLMTISSMVAMITILYMALPLLMSRLQSVLFTKEEEAHAASLAALEEQNSPTEDSVSEHTEAPVNENEQILPEQPLKNTENNL
ncbi:MAG: hypothetical protein CSB34_01615 [Desulfobulbus propionicus]|nr:MAG: hypothetical protein CSB34_01615 [Desulfobulbus propionicus]PIE63976.1 MAG: hypothetical protein CSA26_10360 [Desulfobacterales bacterium]